MIANQLTAATMEHALTASMNTLVTVAEASPEPTVKQVVNLQIYKSPTHTQTHTHTIKRKTK